MTQDPPRPDPAPEPSPETAPGPPGPTFASPTPAGVLPAEGLADLELPGPPSAGGADAASPRSGSSSSGRPAAARSRRVAATAAAAVVALAVVGGAVAIGVTTAHDRAWSPLPAAVTGARDANAVQLVLGSCLRDLPSGDVGRLTVVPCTDEHAGQVVGRTDSAKGAVWPGHDALVRRASAVCGPEQLGASGRDVEGVSFVVLTPSEDGWSEGDRAGLCVAVTDDPGTLDLLG